MTDDTPDSIWTRPEPGARGAQHSREQIAAAAVKIADRDGVRAVSMRRVAAEIGAGTMTLYHYVRNKDELLALVENAIMAEIVIPAGAMPDGWREAMTEIAVRTRDVLIRHPWTFDVPQHGTAGGPNEMMHFEQSLQAISGTGLEPRRCLEVVAMVDDYVFGYALRANMLSGAGDPDERFEEWADAFAGRLETIDRDLHPHVFEMFGVGEPRAVLAEMIAVASAEDRFLGGLNLMLDGVERMIEAGAG